jgi:hypothetical protein
MALTPQQILNTYGNHSNIYWRPDKPVEDALELIKWYDETYPGSQIVVSTPNARMLRTFTRNLYLKNRSDKIGFSFKNFYEKMDMVRGSRSFNNLVVIMCNYFSPSMTAFIKELVDWPETHVLIIEDKE